MRSAVRFAGLSALGMLLLQAAWILAVPPYHAIDEFDHAYRAAGVARGQWVLTEETPEGRGLSVAVPPGMVDAASAQCDALPYTEPGNCHPVAEGPDGLVVVATAAAQYNPLYYYVVGTAAEPFDGAAANYAMRVVSAVLCALAVGLAAFCLALMRAGPWTRIGLVVSVTPVLAYTTAVSAPNSIEIVAALVTWCALLAVFSGRLDHRWERRLVWVAGAAAAMTVVPRMLGPLWLALIGAALGVFVGRRRIAEVVGAHRGPIVACTSAVVLATVAAAGWSVYAGLFAESSDVAGTGGPTSSEVTASLSPVVWTLQIIGAFPFRGNAAPAPVYVLVLLAVLPILFTGIRRAARHERFSLLGSVAVTLVFPVVLTLATASSQGVIWQGRYQLPFVVGILLMCGVVLDRRPPGRLALDAVVVASAVVALSHGWSVAFVSTFEARRVAELGDGSSWVTAPPVVLALLAVSGGLVFAVGPVLRLRSIREPDSPGVVTAAPIVSATGRPLNASTDRSGDTGGSQQGEG